jgi:hypothetical protein
MLESTLTITVLVLVALAIFFFAKCWHENSDSKMMEKLRKGTSLSPVTYPRSERDRQVVRQLINRMRDNCVFVDESIDGETPFFDLTLCTSDLDENDMIEQSWDAVRNSPELQLKQLLASRVRTLNDIADVLDRKTSSFVDTI